MSLDLSSVRAKVDRAAEHLEALNAIFGGGEGDVELRTEFEPAKQAHKLTYVSSGLPPNTATIFGDLVHNARSALDHLVCAVLHMNRVKVRTYHAYPFCVSEARFRTYVSERDPALEGFSCLDGFTKEQMDIVAMHQPYITGNETEARRSALYQMHLAWNVDKHRRIHAMHAAAAAAPEITAGPFPWVKVGDVEPLITKGTPLEPETPVGYVRIMIRTNAPSGLKAEVQANFAVSVTFRGQGGLKIPFYAPFFMLTHTVAAIQAFDPTFETPDVLVAGITLEFDGDPPAWFKELTHQETPETGP